METELYHLLSTGQKAETEKLIFKTCNFRHCDDGTWSYLDVKQYVGRITGIMYRYVQEKCPELTAQAEEAMDNIDYYIAAAVRLWKLRQILRRLIRMQR